MTTIKPRTMPGVLELLPLEQIAFQGMLDTIRSQFERFGFLPIETPAIELADVLLTKTGGETERQVYLVQSTGSFKQGDEPELALRFDLTVPLARYVAEHEHSLAFPFRRYQIQRVYRGESAQRGRFREFYQCDIDVIGKDRLSIRYDAEMPAVIHALFKALKIGPFTIEINNRKLIRGFFDSLGIDQPSQQMLVLREVDKLDKRGPDAVAASLRGAPFELDPEIVAKILAFVGNRSSGHDDALARLAPFERAGGLMADGAAELRSVIELARAFGLPESDYAVNFAIARGLDYYTGTVYETRLDDFPGIGSICSGGRYDNLASHYSRSSLPGVGISIGATRLFWQLREAGLIGLGESSIEVLIALLDEADLPHYIELANQLRRGAIATEVQFEPRKLAKQFQYADRAGIRFVVMLGPDERAKGVVAVKDMRRGEQFELAQGELVKALRVELEQAAAMKGR